MKIKKIRLCKSRNKNYIDIVFKTYVIEKIILDYQ